MTPEKQQIIADILELLKELRIGIKKLQDALRG